jgi:hypothetical protein
LADELSPFTGARTPPFPGFEASCPGGFPPSSRMAQRSPDALGVQFRLKRNE